MNVETLHTLCRDWANMPIVIVAEGDESVGIFGGTWNLTNFSVPEFGPPTLFADNDNDEFMHTNDLRDYLYKCNSLDTVTLSLDDCDELFDIDDVYVDADGPSEYGADDAFSVMIITVKV